MTAHSEPGDLLPLKQDVVLILLALAEQPSHGYGLLRAVEERSDGAMVLQIGTLYRTLKGMLAAGLIASCDPPSRTAAADPRRRYYRITAFGGRVLAAEMARMAHLTRAARQVAGLTRRRLA